MIRDMNIVKVLRGDRFAIQANKLINFVLGDNFTNEIQIDMRQVVEK